MKSWDPDLHPRGRDGRFIETLGWVYTLIAGKKVRGQVTDIKKSKQRGNPDVYVKLPDGSTARVKPNTITSAPAPKAMIDDLTERLSERVAEDVADLDPVEVAKDVWDRGKAIRTRDAEFPEPYSWVDGYQFVGFHVSDSPDLTYRPDSSPLSVDERLDDTALYTTWAPNDWDGRGEYAYEVWQRGGQGRSALVQTNEMAIPRKYADTIKFGERHRRDEAGEYMTQFDVFDLMDAKDNAPAGLFGRSTPPATPVSNLRDLARPISDPSGDGDCFVAAYAAATELEKSGAANVRIVHGRPVFQGDGPGEDEDGRFWHAWVEYDMELPTPDGRTIPLTMVVDKSNGLDVELPRDLYYSVGDIIPEDTSSHSVHDAQVKMVEFEHYGPWTDEFPPIRRMSGPELEQGRAMAEMLSRDRTFRGQPNEAWHPPQVPEWELTITPASWEEKAALMGVDVSKLSKRQVKMWKAMFPPGRVEYTYTARFGDDDYKVTFADDVDRHHPLAVTHALNAIKVLATSNPPQWDEDPKPPVEIKFVNFEGGGDMGATLATYREMSISTEVLSRHDTVPSPDYFTRPASEVDGITYVLTHEWGHLIDKGNLGAEAASRFKPVSKYAADARRNALREGAKPDVGISLEAAVGAENYAEAFALYMLGDGYENPLSREFGWTRADAIPEGTTPDNPIRVKSAKEALRLMANGLHVELDPNTLSVVLDELGKIAQEAERNGGNAPDYDLCLVHIKDTNIFCEESLGISRIEMPQLGGVHLRPGSDAEAKRDRINAAHRAAGEPEEPGVDAEEEFIEWLAKRGTSTADPVPRDAALLKATQSQLIGVKVAGMMGATRRREYDPRRVPLFISRDGYILDGHHRWATVAGLEFQDGETIEMQVRVVDMPIQELVAAANEFATEFGIEAEAAGAGAATGVV